MDKAQLLDQAYEVFCKIQRANGSPVPDEVSFVGGFMACFGIITGKVDIGLDQNAPLDKILDQIHEACAAFGRRVWKNQQKQSRLQ